jgi:hypothetical protein
MGCVSSRVGITDVADLDWRSPGMWEHRMQGQKGRAWTRPRIRPDSHAGRKRGAMPTYQDLCDPTASDGFRFADNAEGIVG